MIALRDYERAKCIVGAVDRCLFSVDRCGPIGASLGCGNPTAVAELRPGERVLDLGSGGGIDVILSARRVGPTGRAIGLDMTDEMLELAARNAAEAGRRQRRVRARHDRVDPAPARPRSTSSSATASSTSPPTRRPSSREIARVLRPGGRVGVSDVVADDALTPTERAERGSFSGCIAGALSFAEYRAGLAAVGLVDVTIEPTHAVADGLHGAIIKATRPLEAVDRDLPAMPALPRAIAMLDAGGRGLRLRHRAAAAERSARDVRCRPASGPSSP